MADTNLSAVLLKQNHLEVREWIVPSPKSGEVLVAIHSVGICGSDVHLLVHGGIGDVIVKEPFVLGHESSGTVIELGERVAHLSVGDRVAIEPTVPCRRCDTCKSGRYNLCSFLKLCGAPPNDGCLTRYHVHAAENCFKLPDHVSFEEGALLEPLSIGVQACCRAGVTLGQTVLICGAGPIGLVNLLISKAMGAAVVAITDISEHRLEAAKKMGASHVIRVDPQLDARAMADHIVSVLGCQPDVTIECSGAESSLQTGIYATKSGGVMALVGLGHDTATLPIVNAAVREVDIRGVFCNANRYPTALAMVASGVVDVRPLITHRFLLEQAMEAFTIAKNGADGVIKIIIHCAKE